MFELLVGLPLLVKAALMGLVEGLTEFLPISSTGHLILAGALLGMTGDKAKVFDVAIQSGAMCAVVVYFRTRFTLTLKGITRDRQAQRFALNVLIAFIPAAVLGLLFASQIKRFLFYPVPVAIALIVGGLIILWAEGRAASRPDRIRIRDVDTIGPLDALKLGLAQAAALIPGTSRSGATIIGGMLFGLSRRAATEFSFYLAVPTLVGAGVYDMWKHRALIESSDVPMFAVGLITAFVSALACVHWLMRYVATHNFVPFAWYRIVFGVLILATAWTGIIAWST
jgi:undecaprenyl-diphosphatase